MTDLLDMQSEIVVKIREGDERSLTMIYSATYPIVERYIRENNGGSDAAKDIFQDAMYILIRKIDDPKFVLTSKISTYLFGIAKNLWLKELTKKEVDRESYRNEISFDALAEDDSGRLEQVKSLRKGLELLGEPCKTLLVQFYQFKKTMQEIAEMLHYTNADNAKNQKYKCLIRLKKIVTKDLGE